MTWETAHLRDAFRSTEEVSTERRIRRVLSFDLPLPEIHPQTLGKADLTSKIAALTVPTARELGIPNTTLRYQQKRLKRGSR
jgi:hypothetical protein